MPWPWTPPRRDEPELMDAPGLPEAEVAEAYRVLRLVNQQLGNLRSLRREAGRMIAEDGPWPRRRPSPSSTSARGPATSPARLADRLRPRATVLALDRDPTAVALARRSGLDVVRGDALRLPFDDASFDLVTAVKFAHHFSGAALLRLLAEMARVARCRVLVLDIHRHWLAYYGFIAWSRVFTRNRLVRYDGPLSVLRGFTAAELADLGRALPGFEWTVRGYAGFQLALVGRRGGEDPDERAPGFSR